MSDFLEILGREILARLVPDLARAAIIDVERQIKQEAVLQYSEAEAAEKLGISAAALAEIRRAGQIEFNYAMRRSGRIFYLPVHLEAYLDKNEQRYFTEASK